MKKQRSKKINKTTKIKGIFANIWSKFNTQLVKDKQAQCVKYIDDMKKSWQRFKTFMSASSIEQASYNEEVEEQLIKQVAAPVKFGFLAIACGLIFFVLWGSFAPLDKAAIAPGSIIVSSKAKAVQHLEGGIIEEIMIKEGQEVALGQPLLRLQSVQARSNMQKIYTELLSAKATQHRLNAENKGTEPNFEEVLLQSTAIVPKAIWDRSLQQEVAEIIEIQHNQYETRTKTLEYQIEIYKQKIVQAEARIEGIKAQQRATLSQLEIVRQEIENVTQLLEKGLANKPRLNQLMRTAEELEGRNGEYISSIASAYESIAETNLQIISIENDYKQDISNDLRSIQSQVANLNEELKSARDIFERTVIKSPAQGVVTDLQIFTVGGVISSGMRLMNIIPKNDELIIEATVMPKDIQSVKIGLKAKVQLSAFKTRVVPRLSGEVIYVSADRIIENAGNSSGIAASTGAPQYYIIRVRIDEKELERVNDEIELYPGMPAEVFIVKGSRTFLQYILGPFLDSFHRAFKES